MADQVLQVEEEGGARQNIAEVTQIDPAKAGARVVDLDARTKLEQVRVLLTGSATQATLASLLTEFQNKYDVVQTAKATYNTLGNHDLITPSAGTALRVVWLYAQAKGALDTGTVEVTFTLGSNSYGFELTGSQPFAHSAVWEGAVDQKLVVNTSSTAAVMVNADWRPA